MEDLDIPDKSVYDRELLERNFRNFFGVLYILKELWSSEIEDGYFEE